MKRRALIAHLQSHGCRLDREGARHSWYFNPRTRLHSAVPRHREIVDPRLAEPRRAHEDGGLAVRADHGERLARGLAREQEEIRVDAEEPLQERGLRRDALVELGEPGVRDGLHVLRPRREDAAANGILRRVGKGKQQGEGSQPPHATMLAGMGGGGLGASDAPTPGARGRDRQSGRSSFPAAMSTHGSSSTEGSAFLRSSPV